MADFEPAIAVVLEHEGGYTNNPNDAGGETKFGICKRSYPNLDIASLSAEDAKAIYRRDFWLPLQLEQVDNQELATKIFDTAVLTGKTRSVRFLQSALQGLGSPVALDGVMGPHTLAAVNAASPEPLLQSYRRQLEAFYQGLAEAVPTDRPFLKGWLTRADA